MYEYAHIGNALKKIVRQYNFLAFSTKKAREIYRAENLGKRSGSE